MRKPINKKIVNIDNIDIFRVAEKSILQNRVCTASLDDSVVTLRTKEETDIYSDVVSLYKEIYEVLPYPLYAVDVPIKYAAIGVIMFNLMPEVKPFVEDNSLMVELREGIGVQFINKTYKLIAIEGDAEPIVGLAEYRSVPYYIYFDYVVNKILVNEGTEKADEFVDFYRLLSKGLLEACRDEDDLSKQLENILKIREVPPRQEFQPNVIRDVSTGYDYIINFINDGFRYDEEEEQITVLNLKNGSAEKKAPKTKTNIWQMDCYVRKGDKSALVPVKLDGFTLGKNSDTAALPGCYNIFREICSIREARNADRFVEFKGVVIDKLLIAEIEGTIYITDARRMRNLCIAFRDAKLYAVGKDCIYVEVSPNTGDRVKEVSIYRYAVSSGKAELCDIRFYI